MRVQRTSKSIEMLSQTHTEHIRPKEIIKFIVLFLAHAEPKIAHLSEHL